MIRRRVGNEFWLISQHDHALLAGELARHFGNDRFARPLPLEQTIEAISLHDCGWPIHDDRPTLNATGEPLDVFETPPHIGLPVWSESARRAADRDPYVGLLVSLHSLSLSALATSHVFDQEHFDITNARVRFEVNKFQHAQIELQEKLRKQLGMKTDIPLRLGLSENGPDPAEQNLRFNFQLLQAMDKLSLCICCTKPPFDRVEPLKFRPAGSVAPLMVGRPECDRLIVDPWPFDIDLIAVQIPCRRVPAKPFPNEAAFREVFSKTNVEHFSCNIEPENRKQ